MDETESSLPWAKGRQAGIENNQLGASSQFQIIDLETRRQARAAAKRTGPYQQALCAQRYTQAGPVRLVVGFHCIVLVVERWPSYRGWRILDQFPLVSESDQSLRLVVRYLEAVGYPNRGRMIQAKLAPAVYSPAGREDREANEAMARLARRGFETSSQVIGIDDPYFIRWVDGPSCF